MSDLVCSGEHAVTAQRGVGRGRRGCVRGRLFRFELQGAALLLQTALHFLIDLRLLLLADEF